MLASSPVPRGYWGEFNAVAGSSDFPSNERAFKI